MHRDYDEDINVGKHKYTESKAKRMKRIESLKDYKMNVKFQDTFSHVKYYKPEAGIKPPQIIIDDDYWNGAHDEDVWIGVNQNEDTNENIEQIMDFNFIHDLLTMKTMDHCMNNPNQFTSLPKQTTKYLKIQCKLWRG